jgi:hypothetical protein
VPLVLKARIGGWWVRSIKNKKFPTHEHKTSQDHLRDGSND